MYYVGVDVGGTNLVAGLMNENCEILDKASHPVDHSQPPEQLCGEIVRLAKQVCQSGGVTEKEVRAVGIGLPGQVNNKTGIVVRTPNMPFQNTPVRQLFQQQWDMPVFLGNDADCAAIGEYRSGSAKGCSPAVTVTLGTGIGEDFDIKSLKYYKVIILSDADQDGAHIRAILLTFFYRYMRELITDGHVYIGMPPLYRVAKGDKIVYAYDDKELASVTAKAGKGYTIQRYKGLGEMDPAQLWETTMNPENRQLMQVTLEDVAEAERLVTLLMGDKVEPRRDYITTYADFNKVDTFLAREGKAK